MRIALLILLAAALPAMAQDYPNRTVRIVTGYAPGGASDILARIVAQKLTDFWSRQVGWRTARAPAAILRRNM